MEEETINNDLKAPTPDGLASEENPNYRGKIVIQYKINPKKAPGYDLITGKTLKELSQEGLRAVTQIYDAILQTEYFTCRWKVRHIIMIVKPRKNPNDITSYRPISLLPVLSKILEKILLKRLTPITEESKLIPTHQFEFRKEHRTIQQAYRLVYKINDDLQSTRYCSAAFIDTSQALDKVWHKSLL
jgi:hypothetical protein